MQGWDAVLILASCPRVLKQEVKGSDVLIANPSASLGCWHQQHLWLRAVLHQQSLPVVLQQQEATLWRWDGGSSGWIHSAVS